MKRVCRGRDCRTVQHGRMRQSLSGVGPVIGGGLGLAACLLASLASSSLVIGPAAAQWAETAASNRSAGNATQSRSPIGPLPERRGAAPSLPLIEPAPPPPSIPALPIQPPITGSERLTGE